MNISILSLSALSVLGSAVLVQPNAGAATPAQLEFPAASPLGKLTQRVGETDIEVTYGRPSMKGRTVFGALEPYGKLWRTGANGTTTVQFSKDVKFGGQAVPAGTYTFFSIPQKDKWTLVLSKDGKQNGAYGYNEANDQVRVEVAATSLMSPVETLSFGLSDVTDTTANLYFEWESVRVPVAIEVPAAEGRVDASPLSTFEQRFGLTDMNVSYSRPGAKGRKVVGGILPLDKLWRTGANMATNVTFSSDVKFGGEAVPAGTYSMFSIPAEGKDWTVILNKVARQGGTGSYDEKEDIARVNVTPVMLKNPVETFTMGTANLSATSATLFFEWEQVRVPVTVMNNVVETLGPQIETAMAKGGADLPYFPAAMFYFETDQNLDKASMWIKEAVKASPMPWVIYRQGLILEKMGDKAGAMASAKASLEALAGMGEGAPASLVQEYTALNEALIARSK